MQENHKSNQRDALISSPQAINETEQSTAVGCKTARKVETRNKNVVDAATELSTNLHCALRTVLPERFNFKFW